MYDDIHERFQESEKINCIAEDLQEFNLLLLFEIKYMITQNV